VPVIRLALLSAIWESAMSRAPHDVVNARESLAAQPPGQELGRNDAGLQFLRRCLDDGDV
jgi:hypothetical protein